MLVIRVIFDSSCNEVLAFKTCCGLKVFDQNLEIQVTNGEERPIVVQSRLELEGGGETVVVENLLPHGGQRLAPGELRAFYCTLDEERFAEATSLILFDAEGNRYPVPLVQARGRTE